ncbi:unnamed protein product [Caenorhabditis auriculariae]|uniref:Uncharacterized protein n=1 Tax=Caenorhabditis auriculariae TaxID=2777116 RepID=A0A8S1HN32_9PELO|nr:unnamed protein product [Caenorhabditis auriculariae]
MEKIPSFKAFMSPFVESFGQGLSMTSPKKQRFILSGPTQSKIRGGSGQQGVKWLVASSLSYRSTRGLLVPAG